MQGEIDIGGVITHLCQPDRINHGFRRMARREGLRPVLVD
jgi:Zn-dependent alcohol dehydrogenase